MKKNKKSAWMIIFTLLTVLAAIFATVTYTDTIGLIINLICIAVMIMMVAIGFFRFPARKTGISALMDATFELHNAKNKIQEACRSIDSDVDKLFADLEGENALFQNDLLQNAFKAHRNELDRLYRDRQTFCYVDIADYINENLLDQIGYASFNDLIGSSMTGIGILGTFVGLILGLRSFDPSTADTMMSTISTLINGIKVAFITSICGVVFSVFFNFLYRATLRDAHNALDEFLDVYYGRVIARPENDGFTQLIQYQRSQTDSMAQFAETISITMANVLDKSVVPTFQKIEGTIDKLADRLAETQNQNIEKIAHRFVQNIDKTMGSQMQHLGENIKKLCEWQDTLMAEMNATMSTFQDSGKQLMSVNTGLEGSISRMEKYIKLIENTQTSVNQSTEKTVQAFNSVMSMMEPQQSAMSQILNKAEQVLTVMHDIDTMTAEHAGVVQETFEFAKAGLNKLVEATLEKLAVSAEENTEKLNAAAASVQTQLAAIEHQILSNAEKAVNSSTQAIESASAQAKNALEEISSSVADKLGHISAENSDKIEKITAAAASAQAQFADIGHQILEKAEKTVNSSTQAIETASAQTKIALEKISSSVADKLEHISNDSSDKLRDTLEMVKTEMASIGKSVLENLENVTEQTVSSLNSAISESANGTVASITEAMTAQIQQVQANMKHINETQSSFIAGMHTASEKLTAASVRISNASEDLTKNLDKSMSRTYTLFDHQLSDVELHLSGTISGIKETIKLIPPMLDASSQNLQQVMSNYLAAIAEAQKKILSTIGTDSSATTKE